ncbi:hypothetical protein IU433_04930 [Nocardia puris]|uniref:Uncharacterized protein n=1 Tax=Nocardia puris TaxID=208602 RepID=A0A366E0Y2_9NOCA|nr:hypothetical protein [Nocardia puris]MBF6209702.1 hypothetical protein [Nocardia puris]MBF6366274.1 hypothetical protein [Nocardia puris]MBF6458387.1 hypothetical protein [Nocardia puris]RBO96030.1 hypothetical protein DFR74_10141 [Nocardia puris]
MARNSTRPQRRDHSKQQQAFRLWCLAVATLIAAIAGLITALIWTASHAAVLHTMAAAAGAFTATMVMGLTMIRILIQKK